MDENILRCLCLGGSFMLRDSTAKNSLLVQFIFRRETCGLIPQAAAPRWHIGLIILEQKWRRQTRREKANRGGLFSSAHTRNTAAFTLSKACERSSHPPALPASSTPHNNPWVSQEALSLLCLLAVCGAVCRHWEMCHAVWHMLRRFLLALEIAMKDSHVLLPRLSLKIQAT